MKLFFLTMKFIPQWNYSFLRKISLWFIGSKFMRFFSSTRQEKRRQLPTLKLIFCAGKPKSLEPLAFSVKRKERKLQYLWYHNFRSYLVGAAGFGPTRCRSQSPVPYRLATPQYGYSKNAHSSKLWAYVFYMGWRVGFEPTVFRATIWRVRPATLHPPYWQLA